MAGKREKRGAACVGPPLLCHQQPGSRQASRVERHMGHDRRHDPMGSIVERPQDGREHKQGDRIGGQPVGQQYVATA